VLLLIGTNDVLRHYRTASAPRRLSLLVARIYALRPMTKILLSTIPPTSRPAWNIQVAKYNMAIRQMVRTRAATGQPIWLVEGGTSLTPADLEDGVHPDSCGYRKLARAWYAALVPDHQTSVPADDLRLCR
jgi:lysophospholipase L1-like esterase